MLLLLCPYCGHRSELEFRNGGEAHITRPAQPSMLDDVSWSHYLFYRASPKGIHAERWIHAHGCGRWFNVLRDTASDKLVASYFIGDKRPTQLEGEGS
jgi:sarcosine oxidase subunit delta